MLDALCKEEQLYSASKGETTSLENNELLKSRDTQNRIKHTQRENVCLGKVAPTETENKLRIH